jgi:hypothetical protein
MKKLVMPKEKQPEVCFCDDCLDERGVFKPTNVEFVDMFMAIFGYSRAKTCKKKGHARKTKRRNP